MRKFLIYFIMVLMCFCAFGCGKTVVESEIKVNDISINKSHIYVDVGNNEILLAQVFPLNATNQNINWKSTNPNIAVVDDGIVTGISDGRTTVVASSEDGDFETSCIVYVSTQKLDYENIPNNKTSQTSIARTRNLGSQNEKINITESMENDEKVAKNMQKINKNRKNLVKNDENFNTFETFKTKKLNEIENNENNFLEENENNFPNFIFQKLNEINKINDEIHEKFTNLENYFNNFEMIENSINNAEKDFEKIENINANFQNFNFDGTKNGYGFSFEYNSNGLNNEQEIKNKEKDTQKDQQDIQNDEQNDTVNNLDRVNTLREQNNTENNLNKNENNLNKTKTNENNSNENANVEIIYQDENTLIKKYHF